MNELSLFSGAGGGLLGTKLLGWRAVGYVENNTYCQKILAQRIKDGILDEAPIFGDINSFIESGAVDQYQGITDVLTAGFPCQPFSVAGHQAGENDPRNMWPQTIEVIRRVRPRFAFLENVPGLLSHGYIRRIFGDLAESGFDARWTCLGADECGAPHKRTRLWVLAYSKHSGRYEAKGQQKTSGMEQQQGWEKKPKSLEQSERGGSRQVLPEDVADSDSKGPQGFGGQSESVSEQETGYPIGGGHQENQSNRWPTEPDVGRVAHGVAHRVDRLKALGNGQVPRVAATAWEILTDESNR